MKKVIVLIYIYLSALSAYAQNIADSSKHLTFKGVPLDGSLDQFVSKMKQSGFKVLSSGDGIAALEGDFAGYKDAFVGVYTLSPKNLVFKIVVIFPDKDTWSTLFQNYSNLKELLTEKYGKASDVVEKFDNESSERDDQSKMYAVKMDRCKYLTVWNTDKGEIQLSIDHIKFDRCFVKLVYFDKLNGDTMRKKALDDL